MDIRKKKKNEKYLYRLFLISGKKNYGYRSKKNNKNNSK